MDNHQLDPATYDIQAAVSLTGIQATVLQVLGSVIIILLAWRVTKAWAKSEYFLIALEIAGALLATWFVLTPDAAMAQLGEWRTSIFG